MKTLLKTFKVIVYAIIVSLILFIASMYVYPEKTSQFIGYRLYTVLTDSMEPTIPTNSLVLTKVISKDKAIKPNTVITFKANRFGEEILLTHYFRKTQEKDGVTYYRTQPEGKDVDDVSTYDSYETKRSDIIGTYVYHIPYVGKMILFLQSKFGLLMLAELIVIWLVNKLIKARWEEKKEKKQNDHSKHVTKKAYEIEKEIQPSTEVQPAITLDVDQLYLSNITCKQSGTRCLVEALLHNDSNHEISNVMVTMTLFDHNCIMLKQKTICVASTIEIQPGNIHRFVYECSVQGEVVECLLSIKKYADF